MLMPHLSVNTTLDTMELCGNQTELLLDNINFSNVALVGQTGYIIAVTCLGLFLNIWLLIILWTSRTLQTPPNLHIVLLCMISTTYSFAGLLDAVILNGGTLGISIPNLMRISAVHSLLLTEKTIALWVHFASVNYYRATVERNPALLLSQSMRVRFEKKLLIFDVIFITTVSFVIWIMVMTARTLDVIDNINENDTGTRLSLAFHPDLEGMTTTPPMLILRNDPDILVPFVVLEDTEITALVKFSISTTAAIIILFLLQKNLFIHFWPNKKKFFSNKVAGTRKPSVYSVSESRVGLEFHDLAEINSRHQSVQEGGWLSERTYPVSMMAGAEGSDCPRQLERDTVAAIRRSVTEDGEIAAWQKRLLRRQKIGGIRARVDMKHIDIAQSEEPTLEDPYFLSGVNTEQIRQAVRCFESQKRTGETSSTSGCPRKKEGRRYFNSHSDNKTSKLNPQKTSIFPVLNPIQVTRSHPQRNPIAISRPFNTNAIQETNLSYTTSAISAIASYPSFAYPRPTGAPTLTMLQIQRQFSSSQSQQVAFEDERKQPLWKLLFRNLRRSLRMNRYQNTTRQRDALRNSLILTATLFMLSLPELVRQYRVVFNKDTDFKKCACGVRQTFSLDCVLNKNFTNLNLMRAMGLIDYLNCFIYAAFFMIFSSPVKKTAANQLRNLGAKIWSLGALQPSLRCGWRSRARSWVNKSIFGIYSPRNEHEYHRSNHGSNNNG